MVRKCSLLLLLMVSFAAVVNSQTVSGTITDGSNGETLIGATVLDMQSGKGTVTNAQGRFSLTLRAPKAQLKVSFIGFRTQVIDVDLDSNKFLAIALSPSVELNEVVVRAERVNSPSVSQMSAVEIPVEQIKLVPVMFGETDVLKAIQLLPGVQSGTEGTSGIYVRGGGPDENLFLLDGVPLYNVNHLGGFFSAFNSDAIKNVTLYKGSFPARFSGRISSVLDLTTNNGNDKEWHGGVSIGAISAKLNVEGPIIKERTTISLSMRRTYFDLLMRPLFTLSSFSEDESLSAGYYFYDINTKLTHKFSNRSRIYASLYMGDDVAYIRTKYSEGYMFGEHYDQFLKLGYNWGNMAASLRWNYVINPRLFFNLTGAYTRYRNDLEIGAGIDYTTNTDFQDVDMANGLNSGIQDISMRADFDYIPSPEHSIKFGGLLTHHIFTPNITSIKMNYSDNDTTYNIDSLIGESRISGQEISLFFEDDWSVTDAIKINAGVVASAFFVENSFYPSIQPRLSGRYMLADDLSLKVGYSYMTQYLHLLSSSNISLPTDLWVPVTRRLAPMNSHQVAAGLFYGWRSMIDFSVEAYYKWMNNLLEYKPGSSFFASTNWEDKVCTGTGRAYGIEFLAQRSVGKITGWVGYTWSRTWRTFEELNNGQEFPAKYDRIHDISITLQYRPNDRFDCGATWVYSTGNTATLAMQDFQYSTDDDSYDNYYGNSLSYVESRNNYRLPAYHRLDISVNFHKRLRHATRTWNISVYNAYNRQNPFIIYKSSLHHYTAPDGTRYASALVQRSLFPILPSVSYILNF